MHNNDHFENLNKKKSISSFFLIEESSNLAKAVERDKKNRYVSSYQTPNGLITENFSKLTVCYINITPTQNFNI